jgi:hypothetical protein
MRTTLLLAVFSAGTLFGAERLNVSVCNLGGLPESDVVRAEAEVEAVFRPVDVQIEWKTCEEYRARGPAGRAWFLIRLRNDKPPVMRSASSLDAMGRAYIAESGEAYLADAYFKAVQKLAGAHDADADALLGFVIAHELGHLLLGEGHVPDGVMQAQWGGAAVKALERRWLQFNPAQRERIQSKLREKVEAQETALGAVK